MAYEALTKREGERWASMALQPEHKAGLMADARRILSHKAVYQQVEARLRALKLYVPWWAIGVIHLREANLSFDAQLAQGDPLRLVSTHVPKGRGPFLGPDAFLRGCLDALIDCAPHVAHWTDWSPGGTAVILELYNGLGYANKGVASPYDWSETNQYSRGKYVRDGVFSPSTVDVQPGCMGVIKCIMELDPDARFGGPALPQPKPPVSPPVVKAPPVPCSAALLSGLLKLLASLFMKKGHPA